MNQAVNPDTQAIVVDEVFPHAPAVIWKVLTSGELIGRWLMAPTGFEPVVGNHFTFRTTPAGEWDGTIHCHVLEVVPNERTITAMARPWKRWSPSPSPGPRRARACAWSIPASCFQGTTPPIAA
jgi:uncharacterized protein YndB with AHSA1/START domain